MDNFSEISKNKGRTATGAKQPKPDRRWTLIFIGNHGKTITLERFKGMVLMACLVVGVSIALAAGLLYLSLNTRQANKRLESDLQDLKTQIKSIQYEKDVLMAKLVLAESRSKAGPAKIAPQPIESATPQQNTNDNTKPGPSARFAKNRQAATAENNPPSSAAENQTESGLSVALEDFKITPQADENLLRVQFKIKNTTANSRRVAGHAIVVLKGDQLQPEKWLSIPPVALSDGRPTGRQGGYNFGINYFKTMRFKTNLPKSLSIYSIATVFIFTRQGELLLEQDFPVNLAAALPAAASNPSSTAANLPTPVQPATTKLAAPSPDDLRDTLKNSSKQ